MQATQTRKDGVLTYRMEVALRKNVNADKEGKMTLPAPPADHPLWELTDTTPDDVVIEARQEDGGYLRRTATVEATEDGALHTFSFLSGKHKGPGSYSEIEVKINGREAFLHTLATPLEVTIGEKLALTFAVREYRPPVAPPAQTETAKVIRPLDVEE